MDHDVPLQCVGPITTPSTTTWSSRGDKINLAQCHQTVCMVVFVLSFTAPWRLWRSSMLSPLTCCSSNNDVLSGLFVRALGSLMSPTRMQITVIYTHEHLFGASEQVQPGASQSLTTPALVSRSTNIITLWRFSSHHHHQVKVNVWHWVQMRRNARRSILSEIGWDTNYYYYYYCAWHRHCRERHVYIQREIFFNEQTNVVVIMEPSWGEPLLAYSRLGDIWTSQREKSNRESGGSEGKASCTWQPHYCYYWLHCRS